MLAHLVDSAKTGRLTFIRDMVTARGNFDRANDKGIIVVHIGSEAHGRDGILLPAEQLPGETLEHGDRTKCYVVGVNKTPRGVAINLSRTHPELVIT